MTTPNPFAQPGSGGDKFDLKAYGDQWIGALMLVYPLSLRENFDSGDFEPTDVVEADIVLIDRPNPETGQPWTFKDAFLFSKGLVNATRKEVDPSGGKMVLGRLGKKAFAKGVGWYLDAHSDQDAVIAQQYILANPRVAPAQPAQQAPAQAPQPGAWQPPAQQAAPQQQQWQAPAQAPAQQAQAPAQTQFPGQWGGAAPTQAQAPAPAPQMDPNLKAFLESKGVTVGPDMTQETAEMLARSFG